MLVNMPHVQYVNVHDQDLLFFVHRGKRRWILFTDYDA